MTPNDFIRSLRQRGPEPVYLFLGAEAYRRSICRDALTRAVLPEEEREAGLTRHDLEDMPLTGVIDDARSLSLFAPRRLIWVSSADAAVSKGAGSSGDPGILALAAYVQDPSPGAVLVFEASRFPLDGEGKRKLERVQKFFHPVPPSGRVEFTPYAPEDAERLAEELARRAGLRIGGEELGMLAEAVGYDAARIASEIEKLRLYAGDNREVTAADIARLVPSARAATIFELVGALGRGDRRRALELLDTLVQEGEYLPLALSFLATQFRHALVAIDMGLRSPREIESHFRSTGTRIWFKKAQEIHQTAACFTPDQLRSAIGKIYWADKALRDARPDDRTVVEEFVLSLGKGPRG